MSFLGVDRHRGQLVVTFLKAEFPPDLLTSQVVYPYSPLRPKHQLKNINHICSLDIVFLTNKRMTYLRLATKCDLLQGAGVGGG